MAIDDGTSTPFACQTKRFCTRRHHKVTPDQSITFSDTDTNGADGVGCFGKSAMDVHGPTLLGKPCHFHHARPFAIYMRSLSQYGTNRHDSCTTNTRNDDIMSAIYRFNLWHRYVRQVQIPCLTFFRCCTMQGHERRTKSFDTAKIFVAGRLVHCSFAPECRFNRRKCNTI